MSRVFIVKKSANKLKKWCVREQLPDVKQEEEKQEEEKQEEVKPKKRSFYKAKKTNVGKLIYFGQNGYRDYTLLHSTKPEEAEHIKKIYINRHQKKEHWDDPDSAGFWAKNMLWNKPTMEESARDIEERYNFIVKLELD